MSIRTIIVDDEPLAREGIRSLLASEPDVEIVCECADGLEAIEAIGKQRPNLLFLDIQMPQLNGFEVLEALAPEHIPVVIFTTAYDEHALRAFEVNALDYLLKPFTRARFQTALQRAREQIRVKTAGVDSQMAAVLASLHDGSLMGRHIVVKSPDRILFIKPEDIDHIEAAANYLILHVGQARHILRDTMTAMETRLARAGFMRINRSAIVNLNRIRELEPIGTGEFCLILKSGARFNMTCSLGELQARMGKI